MKTNKIYQLYVQLYKKHGNPETLWPQWCAKKKDDVLREIIAIGAILTQRTNWHNADLALRNLKKENQLSLSKIASLDDFSELTELIRPAGFYQTKPKRLYNFASFVVRNYKNLKSFMKEELIIAREKLLDLNGIGPETADTILLYAMDKPTFVIDAYTQTLMRQKEFTKNVNYNNLKQFFEKNLPQDIAMFQNFHALIIVEQKGKKGSAMNIV